MIIGFTFPFLAAGVSSSLLASVLLFTESLLISLTGVYLLQTVFRSARPAGKKRYIPLVLLFFLLIFSMCKLFVLGLWFLAGTGFIILLSNSLLLLWDFEKNMAEQS